MKPHQLLFCLLIFMLSCRKQELPKVIYIQTLSTVDFASVNLIKASIESFYHTKCIIKPIKALTEDILVDSKTRYQANRILLKYNSAENQLILTEKDIACKNEARGVNEWGVFGLGYMPGTICVISTFRLKRNASNKLFQQRLVKVCLHEIGHNLGLNHCTSGDKRCMMNDAKGTIKVVDDEHAFYFCSQCRKQLPYK